MYHLGQEAFLRAWTQMQDQDIFVMGEDLAWVDLVQENWDVPMDWGRILPRGSSYRVSASSPYTGLSV